jgi:hypothetical protein
MKSKTVLSPECRHKRGNGAACQFCRFVSQVGKNQPQKRVLTVKELDELTRPEWEKLVLTIRMDELCLGFIRHAPREVTPVSRLVFLDQSDGTVRHIF